MKKTIKAKFDGRVFFSIIVAGLAFLALTISPPASAGAAGTEGDKAGDAKMQAMKADVQACMQPGDAGKKAREAFAKKYNVSASKLNEGATSQQGASDGPMSYNTAVFTCMAEYLTIIGAGIWEDRRKIDKYNGGCYPYCVDYSQKCDHYNWRAGCLK
jgi:hypothetical protein